MGVKYWGKIGEKSSDYLSQTNSILLFGPQTTVQNRVKKPFFKAQPSGFYWVFLDKQEK